jgi:hypothetical protein
VREIRSQGSARGVPGNRHLYRDKAENQKWIPNETSGPGRDKPVQKEGSGLEKGIL